MAATWSRSRVVLLATLGVTYACADQPSEPRIGAERLAPTPQAVLVPDGVSYRLTREPPPHLAAKLAAREEGVGIAGLFEFQGLRRFPAETRVWTEIADGGEAYYRDVAVAMDAFIEATADGETWRVDLVHPDGLVTRGGAVTWHEEWNGQEDCFVAGLSSLCGGTWAWWESTVQVQCARSGWYGLRMYHNDALVHEAQFLLKPRVPPGTAPTLLQVGNSTHYDNACAGPGGKTITCKGDSTDVTKTIQQKGCALVSGAMLLGYHGVAVGVNDLNAWMNNNGWYAPRGNVKWHAFTAYAAQVDTTLTFDWPSPSNLRNDICRYGPQVVQVKSRRVGDHFVLAVGMTDDESDMVIHDPAGASSQLSFYGGATGMRRYRGAARQDTISYSLVVTFHSPGELLLADPQGRRIGIDGRGRHYAEIPGAVYDSVALSTVADDGSIVNDEDPSRELYVFAPLDGTYRVDVNGTGTGTYELQVTRLATTDRRDVTTLSEIPITVGETHSYAITFDRAEIGGAAGLPLGGSFAGGGQRSDVDELLTYARPGERQTHLPAGTQAYSIMISYGAAALPGSLRVELNGADITGAFAPVAGGHEAVTIPLGPGRNVLELRIQGTIRGRTVSDTDRITFIVG